VNMLVCGFVKMKSLRPEFDGACRARRTADGGRQVARCLGELVDPNPERAFGFSAMQNINFNCV
jgi:hypothetical protein